MKKILLIAGFAIASSIASAQKVTPGIKAGVNFSKINTSKTDDEYTNPEFLTLFNAGFFVDITFGRLSLQPALNITRKGGKYTRKTLDATGLSYDSFENNVTYTHLQVPVNLVYHLPISIGEVYFGAGPYYSWRINSKPVGFYTSPGSGNYAAHIDEQRKYEFGLNGIAGFKHSSGVLFNINYDLGLTDMGTNSASRTFKTSTIGLSVGYAFK